MALTPDSTCSQLTSTLGALGDGAWHGDPTARVYISKVWRAQTGLNEDLPRSSGTTAARV
ncbi:hypothetical protein N7527_008637 [Penicillium freii]|nr:hypothetical protein N7527_008637 [Penicillium freii]